MDDTTLYDTNKVLDILINNLEKDSAIAIKWFQINYMSLNTPKCKLLVAGHKDHKVTIKESVIQISQRVKQQIFWV